MTNLFRLLSRYRIELSLRKIQRKRINMEKENLFNQMLYQDPKYKEICDRQEKLEQQLSRSIYQPKSQK